MNLYQTMILDLSNLSENELLFYNFTVKNYEFMINSNVKEIGSKYGVGMSFIYKFFNKLKVTGLRDYIYKLGVLRGFTLANKVENKPDHNLIDSSPKHTSLLNIIQNNYQLSNYINSLLFIDQKDQIKKLVMKIINAENIYAFGLGHSLIALNDLCGMLTHFGYNAIVLERNKNITAEKLLSFGENDIVLIISMRGLNSFTQKIVDFLKANNKKIKIAVITSNFHSPLVEKADISIFIDNQLRRIDDLNNNLIFSPLWDLIFFIDYIKNLIYLENKKKIDKLSGFNSEMLGWHDNKKVK